MNVGTAASAAPIGRVPRWVWVLLILSLALNLMICGVVFGSIWAVRNGGLWDVPVALERSQRFMQGLPQERRGEIKSVFYSHKAGLIPFWREVRQARLAIGELIKRGGYSDAELDKAMDTLFQKEVAARQAAKPMIAAIMAQLKPAERLHFLRVFLPYLDEVQAQPAAAQATP
jgi:uncharacterized membrane protein